jgi:hypothetical protein
MTAGRGGPTAGPFYVTVGVTLAIRSTEDVSVVLNPHQDVDDPKAALSRCRGQDTVGAALQIGRPP